MTAILRVRVDSARLPDAARAAGDPGREGAGHSADEARAAAL